MIDPAPPRLEDVDPELANSIKWFCSDEGQSDVTEYIHILQTWRKTVGRNDLCPCGSNEKFKKCHGKTQTTL